MSIAMRGGGVSGYNRGDPGLLGRRIAMRGDPGIFGFLGNAIKGIGKVAGFIPGIGSTIEKVTGLVGGGLAGIEGQPKSVKQASAAAQFNLPVLRGGASGPGFAVPGAGMMPDLGSVMQASGGGPGKPGAIVQTSRNIGLSSIDRPPSGYHLNKSGYWSNGTNLIPGAHYVAPGTVWVKNRRTNPLNPAALSRSLRRMQGFARATKHMRSEAAKIASSVAGPRRSPSCGCKGRKR